MKTILSVLFLLVSSAFAQSTAGASFSLGSGERLYDTAGRDVHNTGTNSGGSVQVRYDGKLRYNAQGKPYIEGNITVVTNPASQGSDGPIEVNTNDQPTTIELKRNGRTNRVSSSVSGGKAKVFVEGDRNDVTVFGSDNSVDISGRDNTGTAGSNSSGTVRVSGSGSSFSTNGGNWTVTR
jgi:hypothetical protein